MQLQGGAAQGALGVWTEREEALSCPEQRAQGPVAQPGHQTLRDMAGANDPGIFVLLDCEGLKSHGFPLFRVLPWMHPTELFYCYLISAPRLNYS